MPLQVSDAGGGAGLGFRIWARAGSRMRRNSAKKMVVDMFAECFNSHTFRARQQMQRTICCANICGERQ